MPMPVVAGFSYRTACSKEPMSDSIATVIIPNYNGLAFFPRLMQSLAEQSEKRFEIIVVDDASSDGGVEYLRNNWPAVQVLVNRVNLGFAGTCNVGLHAAKTPYVVLLNNDTHLDPNWLAEGLRPFDVPDVGAVASLTLLADEPDIVDTAGDVYSVVGGAMKRGHLGTRADAERLPSDAFSPSGVSAFYRRGVVAQVGYLDDSFQSYYEDVDLGFRLTRAGYRCVFAPKSICYHHLSSSYSPRGWRYHFNSARNAEVVWWANMPRRLRWRYLPSHFLFLTLQCGHKIIQGVGPAYVCGKFATFAQVGHILRKRRAISEISRISDEQLASRLEIDWWGLHVRSRRPGGGPR